MSMSDPLADMLTRIRNGQSAKKKVVSVPASKLKASVLDVLLREGFIRGYSQAEIRGGIHEISVELKYHEGAAVIQEIQRVSRPGRRIYTTIKSLPRHYNGLGISILSTPRGVMTDHEARTANVGGEVLCKVF
ncbi:MAG: 30S ribosomal protein S8 [Alphaproteobacteria bacterium]